MGSLRRVITSRGAEDIDVPIPIPGTPSVVETDKSKTVVTASQKGVGTVNSGEFVTYNFQTGVRTVTTAKAAPRSGTITLGAGKYEIAPGVRVNMTSKSIDWAYDDQGNTVWSFRDYKGFSKMTVNKQGRIIAEEGGGRAGASTIILGNFFLPSPNNDLGDWYANSQAPRAVYKSSFGGKTTLVWKNSSPTKVTGRILPRRI